MSQREDELVATNMELQHSKLAIFERVSRHWKER